MSDTDSSPRPSETQATSEAASGPAGPAGTAGPAGPAGGSVTVRYWAAARQAAGVDVEQVAARAGLSLLDVVREVGRRHPGRLPQVLEACSVVVGDRPVSSSEPADVRLRPGDVVEFLPPFAGG